MLFSCQKDLQQTSSADKIAASDNALQVVKNHTFSSPQIKVFNGTVRSYVVTTPGGQPQEVGIEISPAVLQSLPAGADSEVNIDADVHIFMIPLPDKAKQLTAFDHVEFDWYPQGHSPVGVYSVPLFDILFYKITLQQQMAIPPYTDATAYLFDNLPPQGYIPDGYVPAPGGTVQKGKHWMDVTAPEFNGGTFTKSFVYGSYDGNVVFYQPLVSKAFLEKNTYSAADIRQPQYYSPRNTYYPTKYRIAHDPVTGNYFVSLSGFEWIK